MIDTSADEPLAILADVYANSKILDSKRVDALTRGRVPYLDILPTAGCYAVTIA